MGDALRRIFLSIGVALGLASGQPDPALFARLALDGNDLAISAHIENAFAPGAKELVEDGTRLALRYSARLIRPDGSSREAEETREIWYDLRQSLYRVSFDAGKETALVDPEAARTLAAEVSRLEICPASEAKSGERAVLYAKIGIIDSNGAWHDAPVLWNYSSPRVVLSYAKAEAP
jgi:hypothetical protein